MNSQAEIPNCVECGACCIDPCPDGSGTYVDVTVADLKRLGKTNAKYVKELNGRHGKEREALIAIRSVYQDGGTRCVFLEGEVGKSVGCKVYDKRPAVCSKFKPGSRSCRVARSEFLLDG